MAERYPSLSFPISRSLLKLTSTGRRQWHASPVLLPGKSHGWKILVGCSPWGHEESDTTEQIQSHFHFHALEKEMATHSNVLAWRIPGTAEPGRLPSMGSQKVGHNWSDLAAAAACPLSHWCHPTTSSSVCPFSFCPQSFPASGSFQMSWLLASDGQSIGALTSASVFPINIQGWCPLGLIGLISLQSKGLSRVFSKNSKACILQFSAFFTVQFSHPYMTIGETTALTIQTFVGKMMSLFFNMLSRFVIAFLPRNKCLNFMAAVTVCSDFGIQENKKSVIIFTFPPAVCHKVIGTGYMILVFWMLSFKSAFSCSSFTSSPL